MYAPISLRLALNGRWAYSDGEDFWGDVCFMSEYLNGPANHSSLTRGERYQKYKEHIDMKFHDLSSKRGYRGYCRD